MSRTPPEIILCFAYSLCRWSDNYSANTTIPIATDSQVIESYFFGSISPTVTANLLCRFPNTEIRMSLICGQGIPTRWAVCLKY